MKQKEIFNELVNESRFGINQLSTGIGFDFNDLSYHYKERGYTKYFNRFKGPLYIYIYIYDLKNDRIVLQEGDKIKMNLN